MCPEAEEKQPWLLSKGKACVSLLGPFCSPCVLKAGSLIFVVYVCVLCVHVCLYVWSLCRVCMCVFYVCLYMCM